MANSSEKRGARKGVKTVLELQKVTELSAWPHWGVFASSAVCRALKMACVSLFCIFCEGLSVPGIVKFSGLGLIFIQMFCGGPSYASCELDVLNRQQEATIISGGKVVSTWAVDNSSIHVAKLPNGFKLGVKVTPVEDGFYIGLSEKSGPTPEMVEVNLFDGSKGKPALVSKTFAGANSVQGFGPKGGANRVKEVGAKGVLLVLQKPVNVINCK